MASIAPKTYLVLGWGLGFFGVLLILFGMASEYFASTLLPGSLCGVVGALLCGVGGASTFTAMKGAWLDHAHRRRLRQNPEAYWLADFGWDQSHSPDLGQAHMRQAFLWAGLGLTCSVPLLTLGLFSGLPPWGRLVCSSLGLLLGWMASKPARHGLQLVRKNWAQGLCRIHYPRFPFFLNDDFQATLYARAKFKPGETLKATLRCLEERELSRRWLGRAFSLRQVWEIYRDSRTIEPLTKDLASEGLTLNFFVPGEARSSALSKRLPRYWVLRVESQSPGISLDAEFLLPIYSAAPED